MLKNSAEVVDNRTMTLSNTAGFHLDYFPICKQQNKA